MRQTLQEFESIQGAMGLSSQIIDQAVELYERILARLTDNVIYRCKRRSSLRAASIFFACKELGVPRERKEISKALLVPLKNVTKCCNLYLDLLGKDFREKPPLTAVDFVERYCALLGICDRQLVVDLIHSASRLNLLSDKTPTSVASACILFSIDHLNLPISKQDVQDKCGNSSAILTRSHAILVKNKERILADIKAHSSL